MHILHDIAGQDDDQAQHRTHCDGDEQLLVHMPLASSLQDSAVPWAQGIQSKASAALKPRRATACAPVLFRTEVLRLLIFLRRFDDKAMKAAAVFLAALATMCAQVPNPTQQQPALTPAETGQPMPIFRVTVVSRTISAINYHHRSGTRSEERRVGKECRSRWS